MVMGAHHHSSRMVLDADHQRQGWALIDGGGCSSPFIEGGVEALIAVWGGCCWGLVAVH